MKTLFIKTDPLRPNEAAVERAAAILRAGGVVAIPTETVYGLAADAFNEKAIARVFEAKGRPQDNPLIVHIADMAEITRVCPEPPEAFYRLAEAFWPGPLTMVMKKNPALPACVSGGLDTVAVRMPSHPVARAVIRAVGSPLAAPSANRSGRPSTTTAAHVRADMVGRIDAILDGGPCEVGVESTVVSLLCDPVRILRPGHVTPHDIARVLGGCAVDDAVLGEVAENAPVLSPGMKYRHYAPAAPMTLVLGEGAAAYIRARLASAGRPEGVLCLEEQKSLFDDGRFVCAYGSAADPASQEAGLFDALRRLDDMRLAQIWALEAPNATLAVQNRLIRACGHKTLSV